MLHMKPLVFTFQVEFSNSTVSSKFADVALRRSALICTTTDAILFVSVPTHRCVCQHIHKIFAMIQFGVSLFQLVASSRCLPFHFVMIISIFNTFFCSLTHEKSKLTL